MLRSKHSVTRSAKHTVRRIQLRFASDSSHGGSHGQGHSHHATPVNESFGTRFYITLAAIPLFFAFYKFTTEGSERPALTRLIDKYSDYRDRWTQRNNIHTAMIEQAAHDRNLFQSSERSRMVELKFPEQFNVGSPYNVPAGQGTNLDTLIAHYEKKNRETAEKIDAKRRIEDDNIQTGGTPQFKG